MAQKSVIGLTRNREKTTGRFYNAIEKAGKPDTKKNHSKKNKSRVKKEYSFFFPNDLSLPTDVGFGRANLNLRQFFAEIENLVKNGFCYYAAVSVYESVFPTV